MASRLNALRLISNEAVISVVLWARWLGVVMRIPGGRKACTRARSWSLLRIISIRSTQPTRWSHTWAVQMSVNTTSSSSAFDALPSGVKIAATSMSCDRPAIRTAMRSPGVTPSAVAVLAPNRTLSGSVNKAAMPFWRGVPAALISGRNASSLNGSIPKMVNVRGGVWVVIA